MNRPNADDSINTTELNNLIPHPRPTHIHIDDNPAQQYVASIRPPLVSAKTSPGILTMKDSSHVNVHSDSQFKARYERALQDQSITIEVNSPNQSHQIHQNQNNRPREQNKDERPAETSDETTDSDEDFDWNLSDEDELDEEEKEIRKKEKTKRLTHLHEHQVKRAKRLRKVYLTLMKISRPIRTSLILLFGSGLTISPTLILLFRFPNSSALRPVMAWSIWSSLCVAATCLSSIMTDFLPVIVLKIVYLLYGSTPEKLKTQVELWMSVRFWIKLALSFTWYWVILLVMFSSIFPFKDDSRLHYFSWVKKVTAGLFATGLMLLFEKILLQIIKLNFHRTSLKDRLEENEKALWALDKLAAAKDISHVTKRRSGFLSGFGVSRKSHEGTGRNTPAKLGISTARNSTDRNGTNDHSPQLVDVPLTPSPATIDQTQMRQEAEILNKKLNKAQKNQKRRSANLADQFTNAIAHVTLKDESKRKNDGLGSSTHSAKKLAKKLFEGLDEDRGGVITRNEFEPYFKNASDASEAFKLFDKDGNGDIDRKEMRNAVARIYRERKALATGLKDMSSAVAKLDAVLLSIAFVIVVFIWLLIFNPSGTTSQFVPMATIILGFSFIFGNAAKNLFESMLFIFSVHPYDVGDLVFIDESPMFVLEFGLFSTTFQRVDGQVIVAPNSVLGSQKYILNVRRSGSMWETTNIMIGFDTPLDVLHEFRTRMRQYVNENPREWKGGLDVNIDYMKNQNLIQLIIAMEHKGNWQDWGARWDRRTLLMREMKKILDQLNIIYKLPIQPVSFVSPSNIGKKSNQRSVGSNEGYSFENRSSNLLGNAARIGTNSQSNNWTNTGNLSALRVQGNQ
ncbi:Mechanosensitive ion channel-domain-containing protein [Melampsora americana]|nr:Mechanosensitive ion channel-domain-containing protein [Melampsora americana]